MCIGQDKNEECEQDREGSVSLVHRCALCRMRGGYTEGGAESDGQDSLVNYNMPDRRSNQDVGCGKSFIVEIILLNFALFGRLIVVFFCLLF